MSKEYKIGDKVWWSNGHQIVRCTITGLDDQWRKKHPDGILFYEIDEPVGHSLDIDSFYDTLEEWAGDPADFEEAELEPEKFSSLDAMRRDMVRFILSTRLEGADYTKSEKISDGEVEKALSEWGYPQKKHGEGWLTHDEAYKQVFQTVSCKFCELPADVRQSHLHQDAWVGPCCWDERLRTTE